MNDKPEPELLAVAKLGAPRGVKGSLKVHSYSGEYSHIEGLKSALVAPEGSPGDGRRLPIAFAERGDWGLGLVFAGYESPEKARALTGLLIYLPRDEASPLGKNEYYIHDLVGLRVVCGGEVVGLIQAVLDGASDPLLEVSRAGLGGTFLLPFRNEFVGEVDLKKRTLDLLAGWLME